MSRILFYLNFLWMVTLLSLKKISMSRKTILRVMLSANRSNQNQRQDVKLFVLNGIMVIICLEQSLFETRSNLGSNWAFVCYCVSLFS